MTDIDDKADRWDLDSLQQDVWSLESIVQEQQKVIEELQMALTLLTNDLNTIKMEGCYRFIEDENHLHKSPDLPISGDI